MKNKNGSNDPIHYLWCINFDPLFFFISRSRSDLTFHIDIQCYDL